ncbi:Ca2+-binding RTX toxin-like protein [Pararhizobium capsulatum DSM 1112]|uniref:Ca2+-binding RTX toxin-like protein n=1 Tax=Pararhizobium capsulatum DSM 1112 TaxID=1121113 RepID=A0ABU0BY57_9HYPH|nr:hypothetical protein [Pararhizobium capsulatum]MDQ0323185.1 Ca2+-binding RTX toxin-like protein [Pararhizobium capsulatum DSM 1112]
MAWQYPISSTSTTTTIDLTTTDNVYVAQQVAITSSKGIGVYGSGSNHHAVIDGTVAGYYEAVWLGSNGSVDKGQFLEISKTGKLFSGDGYGAAIYAASSNVQNEGVIIGGFIGVEFQAISTTGFSTFNNSGSIVGRDYIGVSFRGSTQEIRIDNSGTIKSVAAVQGGQGVDKFLNRGTVIGTVDLGLGQDTYDGRTGSVKGAVSGGEGADKLYGGKEANILHGDAGKDRMYGAGGADKLYGGADSDTFVYLKTTESTLTVRDAIYDFNHIDFIDLHSIDARTTTSGNQAFTFIGSAAFAHHAGELRYLKSGGDTYVYGDTNGDAKTDFSIKLEGSFAMEKGDFLL